MHLHHHLAHFVSKKFFFSVYSVGALVVAAVATHWVPEIVAIYPALVGGITGVAGLFLAGDVAAHHVTTKGQIQGLPLPLGAVPQVPPVQEPAPILPGLGG